MPPDEPSTTTPPTPQATPAPAEPSPAPAPVPTLLGGEPSAKPEGEAKPTGEGDKPAGEEPAPAKFDPAALKPPEGFELDPKLVEKFTPLAEKYGLSNEAAQDLIALHSEALKEVASKPYQTYTELQSQWKDQIAADKELGSVDVPAVVARALDTYGDKATREAFDFTGTGNNPAIVRFVYRMAKALGEGGIVGGNPAVGQKGIGANALYPHLKEG